MRALRLLSVILAGLLLLPGVLSADTTLLFQDFNGWWDTEHPPEGWVIGHDGPPFTDDWHRAPDLGLHPWSDNETPYALLGDSPPSSGTDSLISAPFNCTGMTTVVLACSTFLQCRIGPYDATLRGSVNGGPFEYLVADYQGQNLYGQLQTFELDWAAGQQNVRLKWSFAGDNTLFGDWGLDNVTVIGQNSVYDVALEAILAPNQHTVDLGDTMTPQSVVRNYGAAVTGPFPVWMKIGFGYTDTVFVDSLGPGASDTVSFGSWVAREVDTLRVLSFTGLLGDINRANDTLRTWVLVRATGIAAEDPAEVARGIRLLPNPASGCVNLQLPGAGPVQWRLYDAVGNLLRAEPDVGGRVVQLDLAALPSGIYFVRAVHPQGRHTARLVVE